MKDPIKLSPYARPIDHGSWCPIHSPWVWSHDPSTACPQPNAAQAPRVQVVPITKAGAKRHVCAGMCPAPRQAVSPSATCAHGCAQRPSSLTLGSYKLQPPHMPPPTVESTVKALTVYSTYATVQNNAIHNEFIHNE